MIRLVFLLFTFQSLYAQTANERIFEELAQQRLAQLESEEFISSQINTESSPPTLEEVDQEEDFIPSPIFGLDFIRTMPTSIAATSDLPVPNDYKISFGDELLIIFSGARDDSFRLKISLDGSVLIPGLGIVQAVGESFVELKEKINNLVSMRFVGVESNVSLSSLSAKKITLVGAVKSPGSFLVNPFTTISNALSYSGGLEDYASLRNIELIKPDGTRFKFDLYDYLIYGDREKDLVVGSGDTVIIPGTNQFVELSGEILRPFIYEYKDDDTFADLLKFSLGVTNEANEKDIYFEEKIDSRIVTSKLIFDEKIDNKKLLSVYVPRDIVSNDFEIKIFGNSVQEKLLNRSNFKFLDEIVSTLSYADDVYPFYAVLEQTDESGLLKEVHSFSILDPQTYIDFKLKSNVSIKFFSRADIDSFQDSFQSVSDQLFEEGTQLAEERTLSLQGRNNDNINPSDLKFIGYGNEIYFAPLIGRVAPSYIYSFFGFSGEIDEFVLTGNFDNRPTNPNEPVLSDSVRQFIFPAPVNNSFDVLIEGNVNNPGTYVVDSQTSLEDLYNIAGGPLPNSDLSSIVLSRLEIREKEFESVQVAKDTIIDSLIANNANPINNQVNSDLSGVLSILEDRTINEFQDVYLETLPQAQMFYSIIEARRYLYSYSF